MQAIDEPAVTGTIFRSEDKYHQHVLMVNDCCFCGLPHRHIVTNPNLPWVLRHPRCRPWKTYIVRIRHTVGNTPAFWTTDDVRAAA